MSLDKAPRLEQDPRADVWAAWNGSVLLSDEIKYYSTSSDIPTEQHLVDPFCEEHLEAARYNLRLGNLAHLDGERVELSDEQPRLTLGPYQSAVVQVYESVRLPRFLIARWNLTVRMVYEGLLWTGALQVDPGWQGPLMCPVYNLADRTVHLSYKQELFAIDFVRTTPFRPEECKPFEQKRKSLEEYDIYRLQSAPYQVLKELDALRKEVQKSSSDVDALSNRLLTFTATQVTALTVIVAILAIMFASPLIEEDFDVDNRLIASLVALGLAAFSLAISVVSWVYRGRGR